MGRVEGVKCQLSANKQGSQAAHDPGFCHAVGIRVLYLISWIQADLARRANRQIFRSNGQSAGYFIVTESTLTGPSRPESASGVSAVKGL